MSRGGAEREWGRERIPSRLRGQCPGSHAGLELMNGEINDLSQNQESDAQLTETPSCPGDFYL